MNLLYWCLSIYEDTNREQKSRTDTASIPELYTRRGADCTRKEGREGGREGREEEVNENI